MILFDSSDDSFGSIVSSSVILHCSVVVKFLSACFCVVSFPDVWYSLLLMRRDQDEISQYLHGRLLKFLFFGLASNRSILCVGSSLIAYFSFDDISVSGIVFFLFFFSYVFCFISSNFFFYSSVFYFLILSRNFLSVIAVMYFDINSSSAEIVLKLPSFSISINCLQIFSGVSSSLCFAQRRSSRLW